MTEQTIPPDAMIRPMTDDDITAVRAIADGNDFLLRYHPYVYWVMRANAPDLCKVYAAGDDVLGYVTGVAPFSKAGACLLWQVGVHRVFRRLGIASALVEAFAASALDKNISEIQVTVDVRNDASRTLFEQVAKRGGRVVEMKRLGRIDFESPEDREDRFALRLAPSGDMRR